MSGVEEVKPQFSEEKYSRINFRLYYISWLFSLLAVLMSFYYSEVRHFALCSLCWYQRAFMLSLAFLIATGILLRDHKLPVYVLPMSGFGVLLATYQVLLQAGFLSNRFFPCTVGSPCVLGYTSYFGFITIPMQALAGFAFITITMIASLYFSSRKS